MLYIPLPDWLVEIDRKGFFQINHGMSNDLFDVLMPLMRNSLTWVPLYLFIISFVVINYKKKSVWWILFVALTVACTDLVGTQVFKYNFERLRPCNDPQLINFVRLVLGRCSGGYSFISNHAINHFGVATFFLFTFKPIFKYAWILLIWAGVIGFAQIYVGVHYPFDVLVGSLLGILIGGITGKIFNKRFGFTIFDTNQV